MDSDWKTDQVTVVIATRRRRAQLLRCLSSLAGRVPVIVVDNDSRDGTIAAVKTYFPDVQVIALPANRGAAAHNVGAEAASTPYVAFSDPDSRWAPGALVHAAQIFDQYPTLGLIAARTVSGGDLVSTEVSPLRRRADLPGVPVLGFRGRAAIIRREAFLEVGGFSPVLFAASEEMLLSYDLAAAGFSLSYVDTVVSHQQRRPVRTSGRRLELRNLLLISWMRRPLRRACADALRLGRSAVVSADALVAFGSALVRLPWAIAHRRRLPQQVELEIVRLERESALA